MSITFALLGYAALTNSAGTSAILVPVTADSMTAAETAPVQTTRQWLALVDTGDWPGSWQATGQSFRELNTVELWTSVSLKVRTPLGAVVSRQLVSQDDVPTPPNGNIVVKFRTSFANKTNAVETLALSREQDTWKVVGYYIE